MILPFPISQQTPDSNMSYWTKEKIGDGSCTVYYIQLCSDDPPQQCIVYKEGKLQLASKVTSPQIVEQYGQFLFH